MLKDIINKYNFKYYNNLYEIDYNKNVFTLNYKTHYIRFSIFNKNYSKYTDLENVYEYRKDNFKTEEDFFNFVDISIYHIINFKTPNYFRYLKYIKINEYYR